MNTTQQITLRFNLEETNLILSALSNLPYQQVFHLVHNIQQEAEQQLNTTKENEAKTKTNKK